MRKTITLIALLAVFAAPANSELPLDLDDYGFRFVRVRYDVGGSSGGFRGRGDPKWNHDWPTSEENLYAAFERTTEIKIDGPPLVLTLRDKRIFEYPILYLCEPGFWGASIEEVENTRKYLTRGGFILFDDFGGWEWENFEYQMKRVFPDKELVLLPPDHPVWSIYYDIDVIEAPSAISGGGRPNGRYDDEYWGMFDDDGRLMLLACYNQDLGDGWEWPNQNLANVSTISFQMGINIIIYALTH